MVKYVRRIAPLVILHKCATTHFYLSAFIIPPSPVSPELLKTYKKIEENEEKKDREKGKNKKAKAEKSKNKAQSRSKKRNADEDADTDSDGDAAGKAAGAPKPKMPVPKSNKSNKKAKQAAKQKKPRVDYTANPGQFVKLRVAKDFGTGKNVDLYFGTVTGFERDDEDDSVVYWSIKYDDGDGEDFDEKDLRVALRMYDACKQSDTKPKASADSDADDDVDGKPMEEVGDGDDDDENHAKADVNAENEGEDVDEI